MTSTERFWRGKRVVIIFRFWISSVVGSRIANLAPEEDRVQKYRIRLRLAGGRKCTSAGVNLWKSYADCEYNYWKVNLWMECWGFESRVNRICYFEFERVIHLGREWGSFMEADIVCAKKLIWYNQGEFFWADGEILLSIGEATSEVFKYFGGQDFDMFEYIHNMSTFAECFLWHLFHKASLRISTSELMAARNTRIHLHRSCENTSLLRCFCCWWHHCLLSIVVYFPLSFFASVLSFFYLLYLLLSLYPLR